MIKKVVIDDLTDYNGWVIGEHAVRDTVYRKRVYYFGVKFLDHQYKLKENYNENEKPKKGVGFK